ncbi:MAG TPA: phosphomannomutase/phosphoglucomutase [Candidatus Saccharimonadales bacterium]|nr:phosphomannomutase/phosphoglucomutase [Candidatus Saccharimonadales bacterium]
MLSINPKIFKAYDIRGIYGEDFDNELAYRLGLAFIELRKSDPDYISGRVFKIAVGRDMRLSSPLLKENLIRGLRDGGADVLDLDLVSTPTFYFAVGKNSCDGGIMISASHNPKQWNGFKLVRSKGIPISGETGISFLRDKILENKFIPAKTRGQITLHENSLEEEIAYTLKRADINKIKALTVVADAANSMGATYLKKLFEHLPTILIPLNFNLDGSFPAHEADPLKEENLEQLKRMVLNHKADLGIATDGDGDRIFFVDNQGETINPAIVRGLLAKLFLKEKPGAKIGYDVRPGKITVDLITENGGQPIITRVGHSLIKEQMIKEDIYFAGESSGHFYLNTELGCFEYPSIIILKLLTEFSEANRPIASYVADYKKYFASGEINRTVKNKDEVLKRVEDMFSDGKINKLDGISITYPDFWFNVRASNTEDIVRLNLESTNAEIMKTKTEEVLKLMF